MKIDWSSYAAAYDQMAEMNPAYQELLHDFAASIPGWPLCPGERLADLGGGTGNFSLLLAERFPECDVIHVDSDPVMNHHAANKAITRGVKNLRVQAQDLMHLDFSPASLAAVVSVHALYALPQPKLFLRRMFTWLRPGGMVFLCNFGRPMDVADWRRHLLGVSLRQHGLWPTLTRFYRARVVARANRDIARRQATGEFWTHSHSEFLDAVRGAGFEVIHHTETYPDFADSALVFGIFGPRPFVNH